jgi:predicted transcriptional regulator
LSEPEAKAKKPTVTERVTILEGRVDEINEKINEIKKKMDAMVDYQKQLYEYLQKSRR